MDWKWKLYGLFLTFLFQTVTSDYNTSVPESSKVLSRRKRYLLFPEGTSFQLVFCVQTTAVTIGSIFLYGNTAALAWMLPTDPDFLFMFKQHKASRRGDGANEIIYLDERGRIVKKVPYVRKPIINPVFAKRSAEGETYKEKLKIKIDRMKMHERQMSRDYLRTETLNKKSIDFHRNSRVELYEKLEKFLTAVGWNGRQCILRKLCESSQDAEQGTFFQEFMRVIFTLPKGKEFESQEQRKYDEAHSSVIGDCTTIYPGCDDVEKQY